MEKDKNTNPKSEAKKAPKKKGKIATFFKEAFSELKKVSWPNFSTVLKTTLVVLGVVAVFLVVLLAFDTVLGFGHDGLTGITNPKDMFDIIGAINK